MSSLCKDIRSKPHLLGFGAVPVGLTRRASQGAVTLANKKRASSRWLNGRASGCLTVRQMRRHKEMRCRENVTTASLCGIAMGVLDGARC
jgi:hypothetical protein